MNRNINGANVCKKYVFLFNFSVSLCSSSSTAHTAVLYSMYMNELDDGEYIAVYIFIAINAETNIF